MLRESINYELPWRYSTSLGIPQIYLVKSKISFALYVWQLIN